MGGAGMLGGGAGGGAGMTVGVTDVKGTVVGQTLGMLGLVGTVAYLAVDAPGGGRASEGASIPGGEA